MEGAGVAPAAASSSARHHCVNYLAPPTLREEVFCAYCGVTWDELYTKQRKQFPDRDNGYSVTLRHVYISSMTEERVPPGEQRGFAQREVLGIFACRNCENSIHKVAVLPKSLRGHTAHHYGPMVESLYQIAYPFVPSKREGPFPYTRFKHRNRAFINDEMKLWNTSKTGEGMRVQLWENNMWTMPQYRVPWDRPYAENIARIRALDTIDRPLRPIPRTLALLFDHDAAEALLRSGSAAAGASGSGSTMLWDLVPEATHQLINHAATSGKQLVEASASIHTLTGCLMRVVSGSLEAGGTQGGGAGAGASVVDLGRAISPPLQELVRTTQQTAQLARQVSHGLDLLNAGEGAQFAGSLPQLLERLDTVKTGLHDVKTHVTRAMHSLETLTSDDALPASFETTFTVASELQTHLQPWILRRSSLGQRPFDNGLAFAAQASIRQFDAIVGWELPLATFEPNFLELLQQKAAAMQTELAPITTIVKVWERLQRIVVAFQSIPKQDARIAFFLEAYFPYGNLVPTREAVRRTVDFIQWQSTAGDTAAYRDRADLWKHLEPAIGLWGKQHLGVSETRVASLRIPLVHTHRAAHVLHPLFGTPITGLWTAVQLPLAAIPSDAILWAGGLQHPMMALPGSTDESLYVAYPHPGKRVHLPDAVDRPMLCVLDLLLLVKPLRLPVSSATVLMTTFRDIPFVRYWPFDGMQPVTPVATDQEWEALAYTFFDEVTRDPNDPEQHMTDTTAVLDLVKREGVAKTRDWLWKFYTQHRRIILTRAFEYTDEELRNYAYIRVETRAALLAGVQECRRIADANAEAGEDGDMKDVPLLHLADKEKVLKQELLREILMPLPFASLAQTLNPEASPEVAFAVGFLVGSALHNPYLGTFPEIPLAVFMAMIAHEVSLEYERCLPTIANTDLPETLLRRLEFLRHQTKPDVFYQALHQLVVDLQTSAPQSTIAHDLACLNPSHGDAARLVDWLLQYLLYIPPSAARAALQDGFFHGRAVGEYEETPPPYDLLQAFHFFVGTKEDPQFIPSQGAIAYAVRQRYLALSPRPTEGGKVPRPEEADKTPRKALSNKTPRYEPHRGRGRDAPARAPVQRRRLHSGRRPRPRRPRVGGKRLVGKSPRTRPHPQTARKGVFWEDRDEDEDVDDYGDDVMQDEDEDEGGTAAHARIGGKRSWDAVGMYTHSLLSCIGRD